MGHNTINDHTTLIAAVVMTTASSATCQRCNSAPVSAPTDIPATSAIQNRLAPVTDAP